MTAKLKLEQQLAGRYKIEALKLDEHGNEIPGSRRVAADWFNNLILDQGLDKYASINTWMDYCHVGSGSTTPANSQTALVSLVAYTNTLAATDTTGAAASSPYYAYIVRKYRFAAGVATGNLSEVGVGSSSSGNLFSRALILDGVGSPTTITVLSDETLDVTYEFRCYVPETDTTGTITLDSVDYNWTARAARCATFSGTAWSMPASHSSVSATRFALTGAIGAITSEPSGTQQSVSTTAVGSYTNGTFQRDCTLTWGLAAGNDAAGIGAILFKIGIGCWQVGFDTNIPKTSSYELSLTFTMSWARKSI